MSNLGAIHWKDLLKGLMMAVLTPVIGYLYQVVQSGDFNFDGPTLTKLAVAGFIGYLAKQFMTDAQGNPLGIGSK